MKPYSEKTPYLYQFEAKTLLKLTEDIIEAYANSALEIDEKLAEAIIRANAFIQTRELKS